ncbi:MAG: hypothetical protein ACLFP6_05075 [Spirochaetaceae bacterium]
MSKRSSVKGVISALLLAAAVTGCTADLALVATPVSARLIDDSYIDGASTGDLTVVLRIPGEEGAPGLLEPRLRSSTVLLFMPDLQADTAGFPEGGRRVQLRLDGSAGDDSGGEELYLDRSPGFSELGAYVGRSVSNRLENGGTSADTITVRVFALRGSRQRTAENEALLESLRDLLPPDRLLVEEVTAGFSISGVRQRVAEAGRQDPILLFIGSQGVELLGEVDLSERIVATETLFLPPGGTAPTEAEDGEGDVGGLFLVGISPSDLFRGAVEQQRPRVPGTLLRYEDIGDIGG